MRGRAIIHFASGQLMIADKLVDLLLVCYDMHFVVLRFCFPFFKVQALISL